MVQSVYLLQKIFQIFRVFIAGLEVDIPGRPNATRHWQLDASGRPDASAKPAAHSDLHTSL